METSQQMKINSNSQLDSSRIQNLILQAELKLTLGSW